MQIILSNRMRVRNLTVRVAILAVLILTLVLILMPINTFAVISQGDWATISTPHFVIHAARRADLEQIGQVAEEIYSEMASRYKYHQSQPINLYIYTDQAAFLSESPSSDAAGYASPSQNLIAILLGVGNSTITLRHEINHIMFIRSVPRINTVPIWFIEGLAIYESQPGVEAAEIEKYALASDIPDLIGSANRSSDHPASKRDYAQGYMVINFIVSKFGEQKLYGVIGRMQAGSSFNNALMQELGLSQDDINAKWKGYAHGEITSIWLTQLRNVGWYILGGLVVLVIVIVPLKKRRRLREMEGEEETNNELFIPSLDDKR